MILINILIVFINLLSVNELFTGICSPDTVIIRDIPKSPAELEYNIDDKLLYIKGDSIPFSGKIEGLSFFDRANNLDVGNVSDISISVCGHWHCPFYIIGQIINGQETGQWLYYYNNGGKIILKAKNFFKNGLINGTSILYNDDGSTQYIGEYKKNKPIGLHVIIEKDTIYHIRKYYNDSDFETIK